MYYGLLISTLGGYDQSFSDSSTTWRLSQQLLQQCSIWNKSSCGDHLSFLLLSTVPVNLAVSTIPSDFLLFLSSAMYGCIEFVLGSSACVYVNNMR